MCGGLSTVCTPKGTRERKGCGSRIDHGRWKFVGRLHRVGVLSNLLDKGLKGLVPSARRIDMVSLQQKWTRIENE
jgi:hypothetical protein